MTVSLRRSPAPPGGSRRRPWREGRPRPPDPRHRRLRAAPADAAAGALRSAGSSRSSSGSTTRAGRGAVLRRARASSPCGCRARATSIPALAAACAPGARAAAAGHRPHAPRPRRRLRRARCRRRAALVSTKHNDDPFRRGPFRFVERALTRRARRVIAITEALRRFCVDAVGLPAEKVEVVHYGLDALPEPWGDEPGACRCRTSARSSCASRGSRSRRASTSRSGRSRRCARSSRGGAGRARRGPGAAAAGRATASTCPAASATSRRGTAAPSCSSTRRAGRASGSRCSRRCSPAKPVVATRVSSAPEIVVDGETGAARAAGRRRTRWPRRVLGAARRPGASCCDGRGRPGASAERVLGREDGGADCGGLRLGPSAAR